MYEKYKIVSNMEECLSYLNAIKSIQSGGGDASYDSSRKTYYKRDRDERGGDRNRDKDRDRGERDFMKRKRPGRDFKDYDEPEQSQQTPSGNTNSKRNLMSYDDL
jgi:hypothetical protein